MNYYVIIDYNDTRIQISNDSFVGYKKQKSMIFNYEDRQQAVNDYWFFVDHLIKSNNTNVVWTDVFLIDTTGVVINESKL